MATEKVLQGVCDLKCSGDDFVVDWNMDGCDRFNPKDKQVIDHNMPPACLKVCGNCEYFTVWMLEIYPEQIAGEGTAVGRIG